MFVNYYLQCRNKKFSILGSVQRPFFNPWNDNQNQWFMVCFMLNNKFYDVHFGHVTFCIMLSTKTIMKKILRCQKILNKIFTDAKNPFKPVVCAALSAPRVYSLLKQIKLQSFSLYANAAFVLIFHLVDRQQSKANGCYLHPDLCVTLFHVHFLEL